jgi:hypothetical protein
MYASSNADSTIIELLLEAGADVEAKGMVRRIFVMI